MHTCSRASRLSIVLVAAALTGCTTASGGGGGSSPSGTGGGTTSSSGTGGGTTSSSSTGGSYATGTRLIAELSGDPGQMVLDQASLVLPAGPAGTASLFRVAIDGGAVTVLAGGTSALSLTGGLTADAQRFYFGATDGTDNGIYSLPRIGGTPVKIADTGSGTPEAMVINATALYWIDEQDPAQGYAPIVMTVPLTGGTPTVVAGTALATSVAVDDTTVYWTAGMGQAEQSPNVGTVASVPIAGGTPSMLATGRPNPMALTTDGASLYWLELGQTHVDCSAGPGSAVKLSLQGGTPEALVTGLVGAHGLGVVGGNLYAADTGGFCGGPLPTSPEGSFLAVEGGAAPQTLGKVEMVGSIVSDGTKVYFTNQSYFGDVTEIRAFE